MTEKSIVHQLQLLQQQEDVLRIRKRELHDQLTKVRTAQSAQQKLDSLTPEEKSVLVEANVLKLNAE